MPRFSVIIPTYNRATILPQAIQSVVDQVHTDWELIIVDDGSTDATKAAVQPFLADTRIRYHWQSNKELNGARNAGINLATGEYTCFLDDDDSYLKEHLRILDQLIAKHKNEVACYRSGLLIRTGKREYKSALFSPDQDLLHFLWTERLGITSFAFHHSIFEHYLFAEEYILADDLHFLMRVGTSYTLYQADAFTVVYNKHDAARTSTYYLPDKLANKMACLEELLRSESPALAFLKHPNTRRRLYAEEYLYFARAAFKMQDSLGWQYYRSACKYFMPSLLRNFASTLIKGVLKR